MRRRLAIILGYLVAGAVISVLVMLLLPRIGNSWGSIEGVTDADRAWWQAYAPADFEAEPAQASQHESLGFAIRTLSQQNVPETPARVQYGAEYSWGFPWHAARGQIWFYASGKRALTLGVTTVGGMMVPYWVIWHGLVLNAAFFALIVFAIFRGPLLVRGLWRFHRGRCAKCGYPAGVSERCSECGTVLPEYVRQSVHASFWLDVWRHHFAAAIGLLLAAGAVLNLSVVALIVMTAPLPVEQKSSKADAAEVEWLRANNHEDSVKRMTEVRARTSVGLERMWFQAHGTSFDPPDARFGNGFAARSFTYRYRVGWPMYALQGVDFSGMLEVKEMNATISTKPDLIFINTAKQPIVIPLRPMWLGFMINSLFYAAIVAVILWLHVRSARRGMTV